MKLWDNIKNIMTIPEDDEYDEEQEMGEEEGYSSEKEPEVTRRERTEAPRIIRSRNAKAQAPSNNSMQVFLTRPERYEDVIEIADNLNIGKTAILNLENANRETSRRIVDFLSGSVYAIGGDLQKLGNGIFLCTPNNIPVEGKISDGEKIKKEEKKDDKGFDW